MIRKLLLLSLLATHLCSCTRGREFPDPGPLHSREEVGSYLARLVSRPGGPPAISVAVGIGDSLVYAEAFGLADVENRVRATPETAFRIYSVSKGITAVAVMQLVESGAVSLDDDIRKYVPEFPRKPWPITIRHLLTHTSGIRHYKEDAGEISSTIDYPSLAASLDVFKDDSLEFEPGAGYRYTSFGFNLLTGVIEAASGMSFEDDLAARVFGPAAMTRSALDVLGREPAGMARGYWPPGGLRRSNRRIDPLPNVSGRYGSSGMVSTPSDLVRLFLAMDQGMLLSPETYAVMCAVPFPDLAPRQALGWDVSDDEDRAVYRSGGGTGFMSIVVHRPREGLTAALVTNQNEWGGRVIVIGRIIDALLEERQSALRRPDPRTDGSGGR